MLRDEVPISNRMLKMPGQCLCKTDYFNLDRLGGPRISSVHVSAEASMWRFALTTGKGWTDWLPPLLYACESELPLLRFLNGMWSPAFWSERRIVQNLFDCVEKTHASGFSTALPAVSSLLASFRAASSFVPSLRILPPPDANDNAPHLAVLRIQKRIAAHIQSFVFLENLKTVISRRLVSVFDMSVVVVESIDVVGLLLLV